MTADALLNAFLEANLLLMVGYLLWRGVRFLMERFGYQAAYASHLRAATLVLAGVAVCPLLVGVVSILRDVGMIGVLPTLSDIAVARFLAGDIAMSAEQFEALMAFREVKLRDFVSLSGPLSWGVLCLFVGGALYSLMRLLQSYRALSALMSESHLWRRFGQLDLLVSDRISVPFSTRGLTRCYIVIPSVLVERSADLQMVMRHELQHFRQGDVAWEIGMELIRPVFFWNPAFRLWKREVETLRELACDQRLVERGRVDLASYCACLLRVCRENAAARQQALPVVPFLDAGRGAFLRRRLEAVVDGKGLAARGFLPGLVALPVIGVVGFLALAIQPGADWSQDRLMLSTIVNLERLDARNTLARPYQ